MKSIQAVVVLISATLTISAPSKAATHNAKCILVIDGQTQFNGLCSFNASNDFHGIDKFEDGKLLITCPNGRPITTSSCAGYQQSVTRRGIFGYLYRNGDYMPTRNGKQARICWNGGRWRKAESCFDGLERNGACWQSNAAIQPGITQSFSKVSFCAYSRRLNQQSK